MITRDEAIEIAKKAIEDGIATVPDAPIEVAYQDDQAIVTFVCILPPGTRGPDYDAQVTMDACSGEVLEVLAGS